MRHNNHGFIRAQVFVDYLPSIYIYTNNWWIYTYTHSNRGEREEGWSEKDSLLYCRLLAVTVIRIYLLFHCWIVPWPGLPFPFHQEISIAIRVFRGFSTTTAIQLTPPRVTTDTGDDWLERQITIRDSTTNWWVQTTPSQVSWCNALRE